MNALSPAELAVLRRSTFIAYDSFPEPVRIPGAFCRIDARGVRLPPAWHERVRELFVKLPNGRSVQLQLCASVARLERSNG